MAALTAEQFSALSPAKRTNLVKQIAKARERGASGNELREQFGAWLTGPTRRKLFREVGFDGLIARSYSQYQDGDSRKGTRHAREHGAKAAPAPKKRTRKAAAKK